MPSPSHDLQADQRPAPAARRPRARAEDGAPPQLSVLARLQRAAGNAAVGSLLARRASPLQRQPDTTGWKGADTTGGGWNANAQEVPGTAIERIPVEGLKFGNKEAFSSGFPEVPADPVKGTKAKKADPSFERQKTTESAAGRAVVLLPLALKPEKGYTIMLHLHGWGYRSFDPYAGWRQDKGTGTVRDVAQDQIEDQMKQAGATQVIVILVQGVGRSEFGRLPFNDYAKDVLQKVVDKKFPQLPAVPEKYDLVLSGHSGAGDTIAPSLSGDEKKHTVTEPANLSEVVLLDALNSNGEANAVVSWAKEHMRRVRDAPLDKQKDELAKCPTLRAYHSDQKLYTITYKTLADGLAAAHKDNPPALQAALLARFPLPVHLQGADHETVVRGLDTPEHGPLADALRAHADPTAKSNLVDTGKPNWPGLHGERLPRQPSATGGKVQKVQRRPSPVPTRSRGTHPRPRELTMRGGPRKLPAGAITADRLGRLGTPEETKFRKDVYARQLELSLADPTKTFTVGLTPEQLGGGKVDGKPIHKDVAGDAQALVDAVRAVLAAAKTDRKAKDHALAQRCGSIGIASAYRSIEDDFEAWKNAYSSALDRTADARNTLASGPLGTEARDLVVTDLLGAKAVPGFSNHSKGLAIDFQTDQDGVTLTTKKSQRDAWSRSWLYNWLKDNAPAKHFHQLPTEEWHWDHETTTPAPTGDENAAGGSSAAPEPLPGIHR